jgi:hypothetical protein
MKELSTYLIPVEEEQFQPLQTQLLQRLCQVHRLPAAILYLSDAEEGSRFQYEASSGLSADPTPQTFRTGEGLLGQAALEKRPLTERIPAHQLLSPTLSPLVELDAVFLYAIPLLYQDQVQGLLVLVTNESTDSLLESPEWREFLSEWGTYLQSVRSRRYIQTLLEKTQIQNQELATREEELRQNLEELSVTQEEMRRTQELLTERSRWQELVIDLFALTASATAFEGGSLMRVFLAQASRFMEAQGGLALWKDPDKNTYRIVAQWLSKSVEFLWPEHWTLQEDLLKRLERERKAVSAVSQEILSEGEPALAGWLVAPYFEPKGLGGLLLFGFSEVQPLRPEVESALRSLAIAFFSAIERTHRGFSRDFPALLGAFAEIGGGQVTFLPAEAVQKGDVPWLQEVPLVQRDAYLAALQTMLTKGGLWRPPSDIPVREIGLASFQGLWLLRLS